MKIPTIADIFWGYTPHPRSYVIAYTTVAGERREVAYTGDGITIRAEAGLAEIVRRGGADIVVSGTWRDRDPRTVKVQVEDA